MLRWLLGYGTGLLGDQVYYVTLSWTAVQIATPTQVGLILAAGAVPRAALLIVGGAVADRYGAKRTALLSDAARVLVMAAVTLVVLADAPSIALLVGLTIVFGVIDALFLPAAGALPPRIVSPTELARVQSMRSLLQRMALVGGPPLAGFLVAQHGVVVAFGATVLLFAVSVAALAATRLLVPAGASSSPGAHAHAEARAGADAGAGVEPTDAPASPRDGPVVPPGDGSARAARPGLLADTLEGLRYVAGHRLLLPMLVVVAIAEIAIAGPLNTGLPLLSSSQGWGAAGVGWILAGFGAGATATALTITIVGRVPHAGRISLVAVMVMGPSLGAIGASSTLGGAVVAAGVAGLGSGVCATLLSTFVLTSSDPAQLGRVMGLMSFASFGGAPIAYAVTGVLADLTSAGTTFVVSGVAVTLVGAAALFDARLRTAELP
ncbi:MFS transporter [Frigoribacterium faeni]|uniref:MFS transporter n=1 Tax=Frigoribacterium faeni TaxID=145483 RepID=A0ABQ0US92_9MICO|nr:MFS transporter [Frigoribacterium faeni]